MLSNYLKGHPELLGFMTVFLPYTPSLQNNLNIQLDDYNIIWQSKENLKTSDHNKQRPQKKPILLYNEIEKVVSYMSNHLLSVDKK